jgi:membrane protein required for colicin V production
LTLFDVVAGLVLLVSALVGLSRGFVREVVSLFAFSLASALAVFLLPLTAPVARHTIHPGWAANAAAVIVIFVIAYVALRVLGSTLSAFLKRQSTLGALDRGVGLGFGLARALILLGVFYLVFSAVPSGLAPRWVITSRLYPLSRACGQTIASVAPGGLRAMGGFSQVLKKRAAQGVSPDSAANGIDYDDSSIVAPRVTQTSNPYTLRRDARVRHHRTPTGGRETAQVE